jgi:hypothetical protein
MFEPRHLIRFALVILEMGGSQELLAQADLVPLYLPTPSSHVVSIIAVSYQHPINKTGFLSVFNAGALDVGPQCAGLL